MNPDPYHLANRILSDTSLNLSERILKLLESNQWDDAIFHCFACDCAERALKIEQETHHEPSQELWNAITTKRRWIEGQASQEELALAKFAAQKVVHKCALDQKGYEASLSVADAITEVRYAPRASAWALTAISLRSKNPQDKLSEESEWQKNRILTLIKNAEKQS